MSNKEILVFRWQSLYINKKLWIRTKKKSKIFFLQNHEMERNSRNWGLKQNHKIAGITNCEITKCGDPLYCGKNLKYQAWFNSISHCAKLTSIGIINSSCLYTLAAAPRDTSSFAKLIELYRIFWDKVVLYEK